MVYGTLSGASASGRLGYTSKQVPTHFLHLLHIPLRLFLIWLIFWCEVVVSRHAEADYIVFVKPLMRLHAVENPLLEVVKHANLHYMEEVGLGEVAHNTGNVSKHLESSVNMARREFGISCLGVGIPERSIQVVIPPGVLLVRVHIISKFVLWTLAPKTDMSLKML